MIPADPQTGRDGGDFFAGYVLEFSDGGGTEEQILHRGSLESCRKLGDLLPAVAYSGSRPDPQAEFVIVPVPAWSDEA